jgi:AAA family ATP:ADP antiporter
MLTSFVFFFFVLSSYFILRPIRDAVAVAAGVHGIKWLFAGTLLAMLLFNPLYAALVARFPVRRFIPYTYHFFIANLLIFYVVMRAASANGTVSTDVWTGRVFFIWTSVYSLFVPSVFWSFMVDVFRSEQAKRLFGFIGVGGTLGSISGSAVTAVLAQRLGVMNLLLVSAALLEIAVLIVLRFPRLPDSLGEAAAVSGPPVRGRRGRNDEDAVRIGGSIWAGITRVSHSPYLMGISAFLVLYTIGSTFLYVQQSDIVGRFYPTREAQTAILAKIELAAQVLTIVTQIFFTGRIIRWLGLSAALALLPAVSLIGFGILGVAPALTTLIVFIVIRRASNFALNNPAMEVLFTVVSREDKYKARNFIETFVYRAGDQVGAWAYDRLALLGLGLAGTSFVAVPLCAFWLGLGVWLGRKQAKLAGEGLAAAPQRGASAVPAPT